MVQSLPQSDGFRILFNSPELSEVQRSGFHLFLKQGIAEELSKISCIQIRTVHFLVEILIDAQTFRLVAPENNYRDCILKMKSYTCKLYVQTKILFKDKVSGELLYQTQPEWVLLADLPMMTKRGHFVINGSPRIVVHQVGRAPGVYFKKIVKVKKDINNKARFYGDIIPRKGVWVRLQISKKGEIDLKLKKSKKVRAEMVQKCLELLEKEKWLPESRYKSLEQSSGPELRSSPEIEQSLPDLQSGTVRPVIDDLFKRKTSPIKQIGNKLFLQQVLQKPTSPFKSINGFQAPKRTISMANISASRCKKYNQASVFFTRFKPESKDVTLLKTRSSYEKLCLSYNQNVLYAKTPFSYQNELLAKQGNHLRVDSVLKQRQSFFNVQTSLLVGVSMENCFYSKTRQTQTFVIGVRINNSKAAVLMPAIQGKLLPELRADYERSSDKLRYAFTKAEKEAFANVYTSFYKNEIQDLEERVSTSLSVKGLTGRRHAKSSTSFGSQNEVWLPKQSFGKAKQGVSSSASLFPVTKSPIKKTKISKKKKSTKKQNISNNLEKIREYLYQLFKRSDLYDLGSVGREKINTKFGISVMESQLTALDIKEAINWLSKLRAGKEEIDDIDHSQNRRVRTSSELIQTQFEVGITRLKNLVTKRVRNGKGEQIKASLHKQARAKLTKSSFWYSFVRPKAQTKLNFFNVPYKAPVSYRDVNRVNQNSVGCVALRCIPVYRRSGMHQLNKNKVFVTSYAKSCNKNEVFVQFLHNELLATQRKASPFRRFVTGNLFRAELGHKPIKQIGFNRLHFRMGSSCFIKHNKIIDHVKLHFENRITFTSINPYFVTYKQKTIYYSNRSRLKDTRCQNEVLATPRLQIQRNLFLEHFVKDNSQFSFSETHSYSNVKPKGKQSLPKRSFSIALFKSLLYRKSISGNNAFLPASTQNVLHQVVPGMTSRNKAKLYNQNVFSSNESDPLSKFSVSEWFSTKPINGALREFFSSSPLSQYMDQTNPLAEVTHKRRISSLGIGGVSRESAGMTIRGIHPTHYGRICPIETPEGKNAGLVNSLAFYAKINNQGFIETPYYQVIKGQIQHELGFSFYSAGQESRNGLYIAPNDIKQSKNKLLATNISTVESIPVRVADNLLDLFKKVSPYQVNCIGISPVQILSVATSLIPFLEHNDANRALMGSNMQRQAVSLMISERPLVGTGLEARILAESGHLIQSKVSGFISNVSAHQVVVERLLHDLTSASLLLPSSSLISFNEAKAWRTSTSIFPISTSGKAEQWSVKRRTLFNKMIKNFVQTTLYKNLTKTPFLLRVFAKPYKAISKPSFGKLCNRLQISVPATKSWPTKTNYCRSFVSGTMFRNKSLKQSLPIQKIRYVQTGLCQNEVLPIAYQNEFFVTPYSKIWYSNVPFLKKKVVLSPVTHSISTFSRSNQETCLTQKPLVQEGDWVQRGDMLSDCSAGQKGELSVGKNMLIAYIPWQGYNFEDAIVISDRLVKEQLYTSLHIERYTVMVNDFKDKVVDTNEWFTGNLPGVDNKRRAHLQKSGLPRIGTILREGDILVGKIKYSKKKPATPHEKLVCDILGEHNFSVQNTSLYVPKGVHEARVLTYKIKTRFGPAEALKNNLRPAGAPKVVHLFLGEKRNIQVGDKMSGRHGNKGIVSTILPKQDMPYLADGSPIDILLNPLGVPSRMNVGQVFECLLGLASTYLHQNFKVTAFDELYGVEASQSLVFLKLYQARLQSGQNWLFQVNFPGKTRLTDGRSGECLDQWITVGRAYMLKLIHMVNEKIHARAIGPYALVTQQPLKGRAHKGGQRLGEMEVWAVEGFGAAYILQELLTKKSDDSVGRKEVLKAMLPKSTSFLDFLDPFGQVINDRSKAPASIQNESEAFTVLGQPDIFKVLICELQALCLDVGVYSIKTESFQRQFVGVFE